ncbi:hypothetical protein K9F62_03085 [Desulfovibrio sp. JY]|nr:hypothetical protein K9F62_03085 [Desulfovibrio sp. JY]
MSMVLVCEMCGTQLGTFEPESLAMPLTGAMFGPLGPGFAPPFDPAASWEFLLCPLCRKRAMGWDVSAPDLLRPDRLLTSDGYWIVGRGLETPPPAPYVHDSEQLAREWEAAEAAREAVRQEPPAAQAHPVTPATVPTKTKRKGRR